jgi:uncharacterized RmlC-like cupin family protein
MICDRVLCCSRADRNLALSAIVAVGAGHGRNRRTYGPALILDEVGCERQKNDPRLTSPALARSLSVRSILGYRQQRLKARMEHAENEQMSGSAHAGVAVIKPGRTYVGQQGFTYGAGASAETVGAQKVCMNVLPMPPGAVAKAHYHKGIETIAYMLEGECAVYYGDDLEKRVLVRQGEQCFVAIDAPHAPRNESGKPCTWIVVHSSGSDQDGIVLLPELDAKLAQRMGGGAA